MFWIAFPDSFSLDVHGEGHVVEKLRAYYDDPVEAADSGTAQMECAVWSEPPAPETVMGDPLDHYGRAGDWFVIREGRNNLMLNSDWTEIRTAPDTGFLFLAFILEYQVRKRLAERDQALVHASGVQRAGDTIQVPA